MSDERIHYEWNDIAEAVDYHVLYANSARDNIILRAHDEGRDTWEVVVEVGGDRRAFWVNYARRDAVLFCGSREGATRFANALRQAWMHAAMFVGTEVARLERGRAAKVLTAKAAREGVIFHRQFAGHDTLERCPFCGNVVKSGTAFVFIPACTHDGASSALVAHDFCLRNEGFTMSDLPKESQE